MCIYPTMHFTSKKGQEVNGLLGINTTRYINSANLQYIFINKITYSYE